MFIAPHLLLLRLLLHSKLDVDIVEGHHAREVHPAAVITVQKALQRQCSARPNKRESCQLQTVFDVLKCYSANERSA